MMEVLSEIQLRHLKEHKYQTECDSFIEPIMQPFWRWLVEHIPLWWAPNAITLVGLIVNVATTGVLIYYSPDGRQTIPGWAYLLCALGLFVYQTLDAIDGKQARRTNSGSSLGELFDHGCDAISMGVVVLGFSLAMEIGDYPVLMFMQCIFPMFIFYSSHWQTYASGIMRFGSVDVTEAQFGVMVTLIVTGLFGSGLWSTKVPIIDVPLKVIPSAISFLGCFAAIKTYFSVILFKGGSGKNGSTVAGTSVLSPLMPIMIPIILGVGIWVMSPSQLYANNASLYLLAFIIVMAKISIKLVVAHMSRSDMHAFDSSLIGPGMLVVNQYLHTIISEHTVLWMCFTYCLIDLLRYFTFLCIQICDCLDIYCFKIAPVKVTQGVITNNFSQQNTQTQKTSQWSAAAARRQSPRLSGKKRH